VLLDRGFYNFEVAKAIDKMYRIYNFFIKAFRIILYIVVGE